MALYIEGEANAALGAHVGAGVGIIVRRAVQEHLHEDPRTSLSALSSKTLRLLRSSEAKDETTERPRPYKARRLFYAHIADRKN